VHREDLLHLNLSNLLNCIASSFKAESDIKQKNWKQNKLSNLKHDYRDLLSLDGRSVSTLTTCKTSRKKEASHGRSPCPWHLKPLVIA